MIDGKDLTPADRQRLERRRRGLEEELERRRHQLPTGDPKATTKILASRSPGPRRRKYPVSQILDWHVEDDK